MRINKRAIEDLDRQPKPSTRQTFWDDKLPGFGLRRSPAGRISFVAKYRIRGEADQRFDTLGAWPAMTPDEARDEASLRISAAARRRDLEAERDEEAEAVRKAALEASRRAIPLTEFLDSWRKTVEQDLARRLDAEQVGSTERELLRLEKSVLRPFLAGATVGDFDPAAFQDLLDRQKSRSTAGNLRMAIVRFTHHVAAEMKERGLPVAWPTAFKVKGKIGRRFNRYTLAEAARIWIAAGELGRRGAMIRFMLLTAARRSEAARVRRDRLHLEDPELPPYWLHLGGTTKNRQEHRAPLSPPAVALVRWLPDRSTRTTPESELLFSGRGGKVVSSWSDLASVLRLKAGVTGTFHDFRRTIVSALGDRGFDPVTTDKLLNHAAAATMPGVMAVYQQSEMLRSRAKAVEAWAEMLFAEIDRQLVAEGAEPVSRETWGFDRPFSDRIVQRVKKEKAPAEVQAAVRRPRGRPRSADRAISSRSQSSSAVTA